MAFVLSSFLIQDLNNGNIQKFDFPCLISLSIIPYNELMEYITPIGKTNYQNKGQPFGIKQSDRSGHIYCLGKTGTGKSTLLLNMAIHDIQTGKGTGIIDPHGDLAEEIMNYIPVSRLKDVIYFNTPDTEFPIAFNPLYNVPKENRYFVASSVVSTLKKIWVDSWGPRLEHVLRNTILTLSSKKDSTLLDIVPVLTDYEFRKQVLFSIDDPAIKEFWQKEFEPLSPQLKNEVISPILNKVGMFVTHPVLRNIIGQSTSGFDISRIMDEGKIFIANLSKGTLGEAGTQLLGSLLITQFQTASLQRSKQSLSNRNPFYLYIDEMHSFMTLSFADILSESRKYGLCLFLTHQFTDQLDEAILKAVIGNTGTLIVFRLGSSDAFRLKDEFYPVFTERDLINIPQYHIYIKLLIDGSTSAPFSATTHNIPVNKEYMANVIKTYSREKYSMPKDIVEGHLYGKRRMKIKGTDQTLF